jgi:hypothetical protein
LDRPSYRTPSSPNFICGGEATIAEHLFFYGHHQAETCQPEEGVPFFYSPRNSVSNRYLRHICSAGFDLEKVLEVKATDIKVLYTDESVTFDIDQASVGRKCPNKNRRSGGRTENELDIRSGVASEGEIPSPADEPASSNLDLVLDSKCTPAGGRRD